MTIFTNEYVQENGKRFPVVAVVAADAIPFWYCEELYRTVEFSNEIFILIRE